jgi:Trm5-related predicted tRNA methylase
MQDPAESAPKDGEGSENATNDEHHAEDNNGDSSPEELLATPVPRNRVIYLTADSTEVLEELEEGDTYIIGGICDHNRYKVCR